MLCVLSPAKSLDYETPAVITKHTTPEFLAQAQQLITLLRKYAPHEISDLMDLSDKLATLNVARYAQWDADHNRRNSKQALLAFNGDVYEGLDAKNLNPIQLDYAQQHLRILSGLYGVLRPLDWLQPYRLEMGTRLENHSGKNLYEFWDETVTQALNKTLQKDKKPVLINLASEEYFKVVKPAKLEAEIIHPVFEDWKTNNYRIISFYAKRARGLMARYAIVNAVKNPQDLKHFDYEGYAYCDSASNAHTWVFRRRV